MLCLQERRYGVVGIGCEHLVDVGTEQRCDLKPEREARRELAVLDGVNRLSCNPHALREIALRYMELRAQDAQAILQR